MSKTKKPIALIILDGWGYREETDGNAIAAAQTPNWDTLWSECPHTLISGSGNSVGLPAGQMGNSEVGHLNIGAGRIVYQEYTRINQSIIEGGFFTNKVLCTNIDQAIKNNKAVHILGLLSDGGVHSHQDHIHAMLKLAVQRGAHRLYLHAFLDGRDTPPRSAQTYIDACEKQFKQLGHGEFASITGRYYAMDRDNRWDRVQACYDALTSGTANFTAQSATTALEMAYVRQENDEFVQPTFIRKSGQTSVKIDDGDSVIFMNFRADRARELSYSFCDPNFNGFERTQKPKVNFTTLTQYASDIVAPVAFPPTSLDNGLGEYLAKLGKKQLRIAETEKYAHVTFFFNGGRETPFTNEERILIPSPKVATYDLQPEMSAPQLTEKLVAAILSQQYDAIICNYANPDMVGHTGNMPAAIEAVAAVDNCLGQVAAALKKVGGEMLITADHGNVEQMTDASTTQAHTAHTSEPVPLVYLGRPAKFTISDGKLSDLAPTLLHLMDLEAPSEMAGRVLLELL